MAFARILPALLALACMAGHAQYPARPVRVIVPFPPGGVNDAAARGMGAELGPAWGQPLVIENRAGANGNIGMEACAKAPPDGYTICFPTGVIMSLNPFVYSNMPFDVERDVVPVAHIGVFDSAVVVPASLPVKNMRELIALAKAKPGAVSYASLGVGSTAHLYMEWLQAKTGAVFNHVPYKGSPQIQNALLAAEVQVGHFVPALALPYFQSGRLRAVATLSGSRRVAVLPDVPTFSEQGLDLDFRNWLGVYLQAGAPPELVRRLNGDFNRVLADARFVVKYFEPSAITPAGGSSADFAAFIRRDRDTASELVKIAKLKVE